MWSLHPPRFLHAWNLASLLPSPDIQHMTRPGCHLCIGIHLCMLIFIRFGNFMLWFKKKYTGSRDQFSKINRPEPKFFFLALHFLAWALYLRFETCQDVNIAIMFFWNPKRQCDDDDVM